MNILHTKNQDTLLQLSSTMSKMLKKRFGKGPETCFAIIHSNRLIIYVRKFMTPAEEVLLSRGKKKLAIAFRSEVMEQVFAEYLDVASLATGINFDSYFSDWDFTSNSGLIIFEITHKLGWYDSIGNTYEKEQIIQSIKNVSSRLHKYPSNMEVIKLSQNLLAIECNGVLLQVEDLLFDKGHLDILHERAIEIKRKYYNQKEYLEEQLGRQIGSIFIISDYIKDRKYIIFYLT
ncbi:Na-translocating system protein MpsC family protein [Sutcliffiella cohnii]|uniref:Na-translocating system protein MpsC family protein n=1 Tax=Sutcliffiella cohnii TaxID=33932 RepID=UPI002E1B0D63|nr:Na-translocating system protein MpsC family protein [Sutcliffiella cohnii]